MWQLTVDYGRGMKVKMRRGDECLDFEYWPRSWEKVKCWQWVEIV
jgi:hypothetical protein